MLKRSSYLVAALVSGLSTPLHAGSDELNEFMEAFTSDGVLSNCPWSRITNFVEEVQVGVPFEIMQKDIEALARLSKDEKSTKVNMSVAESFFDIVYKSVYKHEAGNFKALDVEQNTPHYDLLSRLSERERLQVQLAIMGCGVFGYPFRSEPPEEK